jgi:hypothetical protein
MRLLQVRADGGLSLVERVGSDIPRYAILSHTWGADDDEVTYKDIMEGVVEGKEGYRKLTFCGKQAGDDGLEFFWVDTCCIDKTSSAELAEAINSMFRWYQDAAKCYVYLSDVSTSDFTRDIQTFQKSRWFTRGWTLQELLAPVCVEFYSQGGDLLGDKESLVLHIAEATDIPIEAFRGTPLSQFSVEARISWLGERRTKREEDAAYCLLGIFDVHMPLLYGEGRRKAFVRLWEEIQKSSQNWQPNLSSQQLLSEPSQRSHVFSSTMSHILNLDPTERSRAPVLPSAYKGLDVSLNSADSIFDGNKLRRRVNTDGFGSSYGRTEANDDHRKKNKDVESIFKQILGHTDIITTNERRRTQLYNDTRLPDEVLSSKLPTEKPGEAFDDRSILRDALDLNNLFHHSIGPEGRINGMSPLLYQKLG